MQSTKRNNKSIVLIVSCKAKQNWVVNLLFNTHRKAVSDSGAQRKPDVVTYYNATKGGVVAADERVGTFSVKYKCRRWHVIIFCNIIDSSALNAFVTHTIVNPA